MIRTELFKKAVDNTVSDSVRSKYNIIRSGVITSVTADNKYCSILFDNTSDRVDNVKIPSYFGDVRVGSECAVVSYDPNYTSKVFLIYVGEFRQASLVTNINQNWLSWTPTWTGISIYDGRVTAKYLQIGNLVNYSVRVIFGPSTTITSSVLFSAPVVPTYNSVIDPYNGIFQARDASPAQNYVGVARHSGKDITLSAYQVSGSVVVLNSLGASFPIAWGVSDILSVQGFYEAAI